jgi:hypothetical protein
MLTTSRFSTAAGLGMDWLGEALLNLGFLRMGLARRRASIEDLPDHLRRDLGLMPRSEEPHDPRNLGW